MFGMPLRQAMSLITPAEATQWDRYFRWKSTRVDRDQYLTASIVQELRFARRLQTAKPGETIHQPPLDECLISFTPSKNAKTSTPVQKISDLPLKDRIELHQSAWLAVASVAKPRQPPKKPQ